MKIKKESRINSWFLGTLNGNEINFKFTYGKDLDRQVLVKHLVSNIIEGMSIKSFVDNVKPLEINKKYVLA